MLSYYLKNGRSITDTGTEMNQYAYLYKYDERNRCIWKRLPGCEPIYYVYDKADRLILSPVDSICHDKAKFHYLVYVYSGEMLLEENGKETSVRAGQCVFIRRDHRVNFMKRTIGDEPFKSISLVFKRNFLRKYYQTFQSGNQMKNIKSLKSSVIELPETPGLESLFQSIKPYFETEEEPRSELIDLKMQEGVLSLLAIDKAFFPTLFDFTEPWKIDILDFLNENYMYELTMEEIASYTGRSLATFKRDFAKISDITPQKWLIKKRLEKAYEIIKENKTKVTDICYEVGFKNRSHFTTAFKKQYGYSPGTKN